MFTDPHNPYKVDHLAELEHWLAVIIALVLLAVFLAKFFQLCKNVKEIAEAMKQQSTPTATTAEQTTAEAKEKPQDGEIVNDGKIAIIAGGLLAILLAMSLAAFYMK